ncbi:MAG: Porin precursor [Verrucomicrobiota bacterium]|jgi:carbohydrate-selective porin OprB
MGIRTYLSLPLLLALALNVTAEEELPAAAWWEGDGMTGKWFGARDVLSDNGFAVDGHWRGIYFGVLDSANGSGNAFSEELAFGAQLDLAKTLRWEAAEGATLFGEVRWRDPGTDANPNSLVGAEKLFNPSRYVGGSGWRLMSFGARYAAPEFFGVKRGLVLTGGWIQPQKEFVDQPLARLFANNAMASAEGLGGNIPFTSSFTSWGGTIEAKPVEWSYVKTGLFMSFPNPSDPANNGLQFGGHGDPSQNGLFFIGETGITPKIGADKLPGRYAFGAYVYGENNAEYGGNKSGYYWQADQMIWREDGEQGLRLFSLFIFAPRYNNDFSFYTQGGLAYEGFLPGRPRDELLVGLALGNYGAAAAADGAQPTQTVLMEAGCRFKLSGWSFIQPFVQYISQPDGFSNAANAAILGVSLGLDF